MLFLLLGGVAEILSAFFLSPGLHFIHPQEILQPNARRIYYYRPCQRTFTIDKPFVTNSMGFRSEREIPGRKDGEFRVLSLGDSIAVGLGVSVKETYASQLETLLARHLDQVRVINAGVSSYSTWQEVDLLKEKGLIVQPDIVLLQYFWNDLYVKPAKVIPLARSKSGVQRDSVKKYVRLLKSSRILSLLWEHLSILKNKIRPSFDWTHRAMIFNGLKSSYLERAYISVNTSLEELKALADTFRFEPILIIFPGPEQVQGSDAPTHMQERIEAMVRKVGIRSLNLLPAMQHGYADKPNLYIPWDNVHLTPQGHKVVAKAIERYLVQEHLVVASRQ